MRKEYVVTANDGFISRKMPFVRAVRYATDLIKLGNYAVRVDEVS
jgi:hypothetical protein